MDHVLTFGVENCMQLYFSDDHLFGQEKRCLLSIAIFLIIQGRVAERIFVDGQRHYCVMFFSVIINACWLLKIFLSSFLGYTIGSPLATTPLNIHLIIDNNY